MSNNPTTNTRPHDGEPYMPSNGTEGRAFEAKWCAHCKNDDWGGEDFCEIIADAHCGWQRDEWNYLGGEPQCTAFVAINEAVQPRCPFTLELPF